ncbi:unnamed protein product, partial [Rotaria sp. Silwood2]
MAIHPFLEKLLQVKNQEKDALQQLNQARTKLFNCSVIDEPTEWGIIFNEVTSISMKLSGIQIELRQLE